MNGPQPAMRQSMQPNIQQQPFQPPMGILQQQPNRPPYPQQQQQQRNGMLIRPPQGAPPPNAIQASTSVGGFPAGMIPGPPPPPQGPGGVRRVPSQPHMSILGGMPTPVGVGVAGGMPMGMSGLGPQTSLPLRQGQPHTPQQQQQQQQALQHQHQQQQQHQAAQNQQVAQQQQQIRMQQQHQAQQAAAAQQQQHQHMLAMQSGMGTPDMNMLRGQPSGGLGGSGGGIARTPSAQNQVMSSLSQPPTPGLHSSALNSIGGMSMGMPPPHHGVGTVPSVSPRQRTGAPSPRPGAMPSTHPHPHPHGNPYPHTSPHQLGMTMGGVFNSPMNIGPNPSPGHSMMSMPPPSSSSNPLSMPPSSGSGPMGMSPQNSGMQPPHHQQRTPRMTPDNTAAMSLGLYNTPRPGGMGGPGGPGAVGGGVAAAGMYGAGPFVGTSTPPMSMVGVTGNEGVAQGGTPTQTTFVQTPAQQYAIMNSNPSANPTVPSSNPGGVNAGNPNPGNSDPYAFPMAPPSSIPPSRTPSHPPSGPPGSHTPQQSHQQTLSQASHQLSMNVAQAQAAQHQLAMNHQLQQQHQHGPHGQPHHPQHPPHAHGQPSHLGGPHSAQQQQQHAQQQHHAQQQQQQRSPPDVQMGTPSMHHPQRPQSQPQRPPSQASRTPRAGPTPIPGNAPPGVGGPQQQQQHHQQQQHPGAPPPPGVSASSSSNSSSSLGGGPAPNGGPGANPLSGVGPSALGSTPLTQTGMRAVPQQQQQQPPPPPPPMQGMGAFGSMGPMGMGPMSASSGGGGGMHAPPGPPGSLMGMGGPQQGPAPPPPQPPNPNMLGGMANIAPRPGGPGAGGGPPGGGPGAGHGGPQAGMGVPGAPAGPVGGAVAAVAASAPPLQRTQVSSAPAMAVGMGQGVIRLLQFSGVLSSEMKTKLQLHWWSDLVKEYFTPRAVMKLTLWRDSQRNEAKPFEIGVPILPRFFLVTTQSGVKSMSFTLDGARERSFGQGHSVVECVSAVWTYRYTNGYTVTLRGPLTVHVIIAAAGPGGSGQTLKFEDFQFDANTHDKYLISDAILGSRTVECTDKRIDAIRQAAIANGTSAAQTQQQEEEAKWEEPRVLIDKAILPGEPVNAFGIPQATMRCLELAESVSSMGDLISFAHENKMGPKDALKVMAQRIRDAGFTNPPTTNAITAPPPPPPNAPQNPPNPNPNSNTSLGSSFSSYPPPPPAPTPSGTLYSSAPSSVTNPLPTSGPPPGSSSNMNSPGTASSSTNSPEKQLKTIPQQQQQQQDPSQPQASGSGAGQQQGQGQPPASASSPAISSGGTTNTPALSNTSLKRKQAGDATSPTVGNPDQPKRAPRKRVRAGTGAG